MMIPLPIPHLWGSPALKYPPARVLTDERQGSRATATGALRLALLLLLLTGFALVLVWARYLPAARAGDKSILEPLAQAAFACGVIAMSLVFVGRYQVRWLPLIAPLYSILAGFFLAGASLTAEAEFPGIALNTVLTSMAIVAAMAWGYRLRWFKPTARFRAALFSVTAGIAVVYLAAFCLRFVGVQIPFINESGWGGILWIGFICTVASMHLLVDFETIVKLDHQARPPYMEWYAALGLMVTLVWLYLFLLRLLQQLRR